jgi:hypothetical protein
MYVCMYECALLSILALERIFEVTNARCLYTVFVVWEVYLCIYVCMHVCVSSDCLYVLVLMLISLYVRTHVCVCVCVCVFCVFFSLL